MRFSTGKNRRQSRSSACGELARSELVCGELACPELAEGVELVEGLLKIEK